MTTDADYKEFGYEGGDDAEEILKWALARFTHRIAVASSLQDSVLIHLAAQIDPSVRVFSIDTGRLPEETYQCAQDIRDQLGVAIHWYFPRHAEVESLTTAHGPFSFKNNLEDRKKCCLIRKVEPLNRALEGLDAWVTGLRRDENVTRTAVRKIERDSAHGGLLKINPLADWSAADVQAYLLQHRLPYNRLLDRGYPSIGCACCTQAVEPGADPRSGRWAWEQAEHKECGLHVPNWNI